MTIHWMICSIYCMRYGCLPCLPAKTIQHAFRLLVERFTHFTIANPALLWYSKERKPAGARPPRGKLRNIHDHAQGNRPGRRGQHDHGIQRHQRQVQPRLRRHRGAHPGADQPVRLCAQPGGPFPGPAGEPCGGGDRPGRREREHLPQPLCRGIRGRADHGAAPQRLLSPDPLHRRLPGRGG